jgi:hypothetical protein
MPKQKLQLQQQLDSVPIRNRGARVTRAEDGTVAVEVEFVYTGWMRWIQGVLRPSRHRRFELDAVGTRLYDRIDGVRTFERMIDEFAAEHALTFFEARALLMQYMRLLMHKGIVVIGVKE